MGADEEPMLQVLIEGRQIPRIAPVRIITKNAENEIPILISDYITANLLGRGKIQCPPQGMFINEDQMFVKKEKVYCIYCSGDVTGPMSETSLNWE